VHETYDPLRRPWLRRFWTAAAVVLALYAILPLWWMLGSALKPAGDIFDGLNPLRIAALLPGRFTLEHFDSLAGTPFPRAFVNSMVVVTVSVVLGVLLSALAAYGLAMFRFRGQGVLFALVVISFLVPFDAVALPLSAVFRDWGLDNTYAGLILPGIGNGFAVFLLRQFFLGIPREIIEAARVDGMSELRIFATIVLPLSKPALISAGQLVFVFQWQSFLWPLLIATDPRMTVAPVALASFAGQFDVDFGQMFAGATLTAVAPMVILLFAQRYFTTSVALSGSKL
jgi:ABC-type glycerol-3-phosphate transport system permease component